MKILIVEDDRIEQRDLKQQLENDFIVLQALTEDEARTLIAQHDDIQLIGMDACLGGNRPNTMELVIEIRNNGLEIPIVAMSSIPTFSRLLMDVGCSHMVRNKLDLPDLARKLLNVGQQ